MTRNEALELGNDVFEEYLPKVKKKDRVNLLAMLFEELEVGGALDLEDGIGDGSPAFPKEEDEEF
jgi:hypothetical protein